jgi:hypothetical protein
MRNKFSTNQIDEGTDRGHLRDQLAVSWNPDGRVTAAWPTIRDGSGNWEVEVERFNSDFNLPQAINLRRGGQAGNLPISSETYFLTPLPEFSERTRILALDGDRLALDDQSLLEWLIAAEQQVVLGTDNHPLFETSLDDTACVIRRLPNGLVAMTEVPRAHVLAAHERARTLLGDRIARQIDLTIETPVRTTARYFLTAVKEGELVQRAGKESEVTAFILIGHSGFRFGLWSPAAGLFSEHGFLAPKDIAHLGSHHAGGRIPQSTDGDVARRLDSYVHEAFDQLSLQLSKEKLEQLQLTGYAQVVWASEAGLSETIPPIAAEHAATTGIQVFHLEAPIDEALVGGLLLGSFAFGDASTVGAAILPQADLARDLLVLSDTEQDQRRLDEQLLVQERRSKTIFTLLAAPTAVTAVLLAMLGGLIFTWIVTGIRDAQAIARTRELKPALDRRNSYEANLKWYQEFIKQVSRLRRQQPVGIGMLYQLNSNYPYTVDPSFFISDMKLLPTGAVEMKGYARNKDAVASFLKSLEFAGGPESGSRLFGNLAYEVQESAPAAPLVPAQNVPIMAGSALQANQTRPGIIVWSMKGNYIPMEEFQPPAPPVKKGAGPANPGGVPAKPGAAPSKAPADPSTKPAAEQ